jgi:hypothetical protein
MVAALAAVVVAVLALRARGPTSAADVVEIRPSAVAGPSAESQNQHETSAPSPAVDAPEVSARLPAVEISTSDSGAAAAPSVQEGLAQPAPKRPRVPTYRAPARPRRPQLKSEPESAEPELDRPNYGI